MKRIGLFSLYWFATIAAAHTFSSGSTGAEGALDLTNGDQVVQLPKSGILNYTTVNIPAGRTMSFVNNLRNTPVMMLAQGAVTVSGTISVAGMGQAPGPGGFYGGAPYQPGFGPGAGQPSPANMNGAWIGPLDLFPIIGGSGGAGLASGCNSGSGWWNGGGGGGAIVIASSTTITVSGSGFINASSANGAGSGGFGGCGIFAGAGAAGAIRLVANSVNVSGTFYAAVARLEAPVGQATFTGYDNGTAPVISTINPHIVPTPTPSLTVESIGGHSVPSYSGTSFQSIDVLLPRQLQDPIPVVVQATNIPVGSPVTVAFYGSVGATSTTAALVGTTESTTATLYVSGLSRGALTYLFVMANFDAALIARNLEQGGPDAVSKIEVAAALGRESHYRFLRSDGSEVSPSRLPLNLKSALGLYSAASAGKY